MIKELCENMGKLEDFFNEVEKEMVDHFKNSQIGVRSRKLTKIKKTPNVITAEFKVSSNGERPMFDEDFFEKVLKYIGSQILSGNERLFVRLSYDRPRRDRSGKIAGPSTMYLEISTSKLRYGAGESELTNFEVDANL